MRNDYMLRCHTEDKRDLLKEKLHEARYLCRDGNYAVILKGLDLLIHSMKRQKELQEAKTQPE